MQIAIVALIRRKRGKEGARVALRKEKGPGVVSFVLLLD